MKLIVPFFSPPQQMMIHAWDNYKLYAWGKNELKPITKRGHSGSIFGAYDLGATIVDGLDTLYLMGLHKEFDEGRDWVERKFSLDSVSNDLSVFETNIRFVGGFLTCYAFTGDRLFLEKAKYVADKLLPAFQTPTGIPYALVNVNTGVSAKGILKKSFLIIYSEDIYLYITYNNHQRSTGMGFEVIVTTCGALDQP